jgi:signal recognition particle GTPase
LNRLIKQFEEMGKFMKNMKGARGIGGLKMPGRGAS